ncbi:MAG: DUF459 domain-containing protein [Alphaproteobacteria bacterium]
MRRKFSLALIVFPLGRIAACALPMLFAAAANAQTSKAPAPKPYTIAVIGDSQADGIWGAVYRATFQETGVKVLREAINSSGFTSMTWIPQLQAIVAKQPVHAVVMFIGTNDRQWVVAGPRTRHPYGTKEWNDAYLERVDAFMAYTQAKELKTVWVGLPVMRKADLSETAKRLNDLFETKAKTYGVLYVPSWGMTVDEKGEYAAYKAGADGRQQLIRANDGIHLTDRGYDLIAGEILKLLRPDIDLFKLLQAPPL